MRDEEGGRAFLVFAVLRIGEKTWNIAEWWDLFRALLTLRDGCGVVL